MIKFLNVRGARKKIEILCRNYAKRGSLGVDCAVKNGTLGVRFASKKSGSIDSSMISADMGLPLRGTKPPDNVKRFLVQLIDSFGR